jgi:hypothetical protein
MDLEGDEGDFQIKNPEDNSPGHIFLLTKINSALFVILYP